MVKFDIDKTEYATMHGLKDFQRATVERIDTLFEMVRKEFWLQMKLVWERL